MKKHMALASQVILAAGVLSVTAGTAFAAGEEEQLKTISGKIQSVQGDRLVLEQGGMFQGDKQLDFRADNNTDILRKEPQLELSSLQPGREVEIHYKEENGQQIASAIIVDQEDLSAGQSGAAQPSRPAGMSTSGAVSTQPGQSSPSGSMSQSASPSTGSTRNY